MAQLTAEEVKNLKEEMKVYETHAGKVNEVLSSVSESLGLYDFGGGNFVAPLPETMNFNGKEHRVYVLTFEDGK